MLKKTKFVNIICIVLVLSVLALAIAVGFFGLNALKNDMPIDMLAGFEDSYEEETIAPPPPIDMENNLLPYRVRSDKTQENVYLRAQSYGDHTGNEWLTATPYTKLMDEKYPATYLSSKFIEYRNFADPIALEIVPNNVPKIVPSYTATTLLGNPYKEEYTIPANDVEANPIGNEYYRMYYYNYSNISTRYEGVDPNYADYEDEYREFVESQYLNIDPEMKEYLLGIVEEKKIDRYDQNLPLKIAQYVKSIGEYSVAYDVTLDDQENVVKAFIEDYQMGNCKHFATVGTLMFRALGIPARFVVGYMTETVEGEWVQLTNLDAHAWVEIYVEGFGWKTIEVTPPRENIDITLKPITVKKIYDGAPLLPEQKIEGFEEYEELGYTYEVVISGEITEPGRTQSIIESIKIYDANKKDVTHKFNLTLESGVMLVKVGTVTLCSENVVYRYDGQTPMSKLDYCSYILPEIGLWQGHTIEMVSDELPSEMGLHPHTFSVIITDSDGNIVNWMYELIGDYGSIEIVSNNIVIQAKSATKVYDGSALVLNDYDIISGLLATGDEIKSCNVIVSQTIPGSALNVVDLASIVIVNQAGEDVTSNYQIEVRTGTLTVTRK